MDLTHLPLLTYLFDWKNTGGTIIFGFLGLAVCAAVCGVLWYQLKHQDYGD